MNPLTLEAAIKLATEAHAGQVRKGNAEPYILHPIREGDRPAC